MNVITQARIRTAIANAVLWATLFGTAGDMAWWQGWAYMAVLWINTMLGLCGPLRLDEGFIEERTSKKPGRKGWDRIFVALAGVFTIAELIVPALDHRHQWTRPLPMSAILLALELVVIGTAGLVWAMRVNRRSIQFEHGHAVCGETRHGE